MCDYCDFDELESDSDRCFPSDRLYIRYDEDLLPDVGLTKVGKDYNEDLCMKENEIFLEVDGEYPVYFVIKYCPMCGRQLNDT